MNCQTDVIVLLLGVNLIWAEENAEDDTSSIEHSTEDYFNSSSRISSVDIGTIKYLQNIYYEFDNDTHSVQHSKVRVVLYHALFESVNNFLNKSGAKSPNSIHRFNAHDLSKVLQIFYSPDHMEPNYLNKFSSYSIPEFLESEEKKCRKDPERNRSCTCDPDCRKYGDCCADSKYFNPQEQKLGTSRYNCTEAANGNAFTVNTCHFAWYDPFVRHKCEHPNKNYDDPLRYIPVTSLRTNISYRNSHCAVCNNDYLHNNIVLWPIAIMSEFDFSMLHHTESLARRLVYMSENSTWYLNLTGAYANPDYFGLVKCPSEEEIHIEYKGEVQKTKLIYSNNQHHIIDSAPLIKCWLLPMIPEYIINIRRCEIGIDKCAENWQDNSVKEQCEAYYAPVQHCDKLYRNRHCVTCNNWDSEIRSYCFNQNPQPHYVFWSFRQEMCKELHVFDPVFLQCRLLFNPAEYRQESIPKPDSERRMILQKGEYLLSNDRSTVFVPAHNRLYRNYEFAVQDNQIILYLSHSPKEQYLPDLNYVSAIAISVSILMLILHIVISLLLPEKSLMEKNVRSFCVSLLLVYISFIVSGSVTLGSIPCMVTAALLYYALLVSFIWKLIIPLDTLKTIKRAIHLNNYLTAEASCCSFPLYSSLAWLTPIAILGLALAADFIHPDSSFAPGYGKPICWFNHSSALIKFCLVPFALVLILNTALTCWTAYLIFDTEETLVLHSMLRTEFYFSVRLVILANLCWVVGIFASYVNTHGEWYIFVILHSFQGVHIFFASSFTQLGRKMTIL